MTTPSIPLDRPDGTPSGAGAAILIVEDDAIQALDLRMQVQAQGYRVIGTAASADEARRLTQAEWPALVLMDIHLRQGPDGVDLAAQLNQTADLPVIFLTAYSDPETVRRAARIGAYGFVTKPYEERELRAAIEVALAKSALERRATPEEQWFAQSMRCAQDGVLLTDPGSRVRFLNPIAEGWTGWSEVEAIGRPLSEVLVLEPAEGEGTGDPAAALRAAIEAGQVLPMLPAVSAVARDRRRMLLDVSCAPIANDDGRRLGCIVQLRDAEARRSVEERRHTGLQRFRVAFDRAPLGMALVAPDGRLLEVNDALCTLLGQGRDALLGTRQVELTLPEDQALEAQQLALLASGERSMVQFERRCRHADGESIWSLTSVSRVADPAAADEDTEPLLLYQVVDFGPQREAAQAVALAGAQQLQQQVDAAVRQTTQALLSRASHELRTPLNAVLGFAQLLQSGQASTVPSRVQAYAGYIVDAGGHLLRLVNDLLDLQRADEGTLPLAMETVDLRDQIDQALAPLRSLADFARITIRIEVPTGLRVRADPKRLRQIVAELASNGLKFARAGSVLHWGIAARTKAEGGKGAPGQTPLVRLCVDDQGPGLDPEQLQRAFRLFDRVGREGGPGAGLGLALARRLAERMGGGLALEPVEGGGTRAVLELRATG